MPVPIVRSGMRTNQAAIEKNPGIVFPQPEGRIPGVDEGDIVVESWAMKYRLQLNSPDVAVNLVTGTKTHARNDVILFDGSYGDVFGVFVCKGPERDRHLEEIKKSRNFGAPFQSNMWLRGDRLKIEVDKAVEQVVEALRARPDLHGVVSRRLKELAGAPAKFEMPPAPDSDGSKIEDSSGADSSL